MDEDAGEPVRRADDAARVREWELVLASAGIPYLVEQRDSAWRLVVGQQDAEAARAALDAYERERLPEAPPPAPAPYEDTYLGVTVAVLLAACYRVTGPARPGTPWFDAGAASAAKIVAGEVWRAVTALTLHADAAHVLGNIVAATVFVTVAGRVVGPGVAAALVLAAGAGGNALNAVVRGGAHTSVGASTAVFGAIGILGGLGFMTRRRRPGPLRRAWIPIGGSLALLAMLGTGEESDLGAHLFGLVVGLGIGVVAAPVAARPPGRGVQRALGVVALGVVMGCWVVARR